MSVRVVLGKVTGYPGFDLCTAHTNNSALMFLEMNYGDALYFNGTSESNQSQYRLLTHCPYILVQRCRRFIHHFILIDPGRFAWRVVGCHTGVRKLIPHRFQLFFKHLLEN